jgi:SAM-dependent methyltransferase
MANSLDTLLTPTGNSLLDEANRMEYDKENEKRNGVSIVSQQAQYQASLESPEVQGDQPKALDKEIELTTSDDFLPYAADYDLREQAYQDQQQGTVREDGTVSNQYLQPQRRTVHGIDIATGQRILSRGKGVPEAEEKFEQGAAQLRDSTFNAQRGYDNPQAIESLATVAEGTLLEDGEYEEYERNINMVGATPEQAQLAWDLANVRQDSEYAAEAIASDVERQLQEGIDSDVEYEDRPSISSEELQGNSQWLNAAGALYEAEQGRPFEGDPEELHNFAITTMQAYHWNLTAMGYMISRAHAEGSETSENLLTMLDYYGQLEFDMERVPGNVFMFATDPMNFVSLGGGAAAKLLASRAVNATAKKILENIVTRAAVAGSVEGGMTMAGIEAGEQTLEIDAGRREEMSGTDIAKMGGMGMAGGALLGGTIGGAIKMAPEMVKLKRQVMKNLREAQGQGPMRGQIGAINPGAVRLHGIPREYTVDSGVDLNEKPAVLKAINPVNLDRQAEALDSLAEAHADPLSSADEWVGMEMDLTGKGEVPPVPYRAIDNANDMDAWAEDFGRLDKAQLKAAAEGFEAIDMMKKLYEDGVATPHTTSKVFLWGILSRSNSAYPHESAFLDAAVNDKLDDWIDLALERPWTEADVKAYREWAAAAIPAGAPGKSSTSNLNDFGGVFLKKLSERNEDGVAKLQQLHNDIADHNIPSYQVRRNYYGLGTGLGVENKVLSFILLMTGRDDVMVLDRIQINYLWDTGRYGKLIYEDIASMFSGAHGLARYEALERSLAERIPELYDRVGRPQDASVGRYHWESWVNNSGQVVGHPTIRGIEAEGRKKLTPYADLAAPEGRYHQYAYGAMYARGEDNAPYVMYNDSQNQTYKFGLEEFRDFLSTIKKPGTGVRPKEFKVSDYREKGIPWYEAPEVNREKLDEIIREKGTPISREEVLRETERGSQADGPRELPPAENSGRTQVATTTGSYVKAAAYLDELGVTGKTLDYGAGLGKGSEAMGADSFEPHPKPGFEPTYGSESEIKDESYSRIVSLNVLNVVPPTVRDNIVQNIARILKPGGVANIGTRGANEVLATKGKIDMSHIEEGAIETSRGTYQKGFTATTLREYLQKQLGDGFEVKPVPSKKGGAVVNMTITKVK